jgi:predicted O-linked N-acetylglucosamine transferase (SPINDLY family)
MDQLLYQAVQLHQSGQLAEAERLYLQLQARMPADYRLLHLLALLRFQQGRHHEALQYGDAALKLQPAAAETISNRALSLQALGRSAEALAAFDRALALAPGHVQSWSNRGGALMALGRLAEALASFERAIALKPDFVPAWNNRGQALRATGRLEEAVASFDRAVALDPRYVEGFNERGLTLRELKQRDRALADFSHVVALDPNHAPGFNNRGATLWDMDRIDEAKADFDRAIALKPDFTEALDNRAQMMWARRGALAAAIADMESLVRHDPGAKFALGNLMHLKMYAGDWRDFETDKARLDEGMRAGRLVTEPFVYQGISQSPADLAACSRLYAAAQYPARPAQAPAVHSHERIRIGYVCGEFRRQATTYLAAGLFEHHDKSRFTITAFDNGASDGSDMRARLEAAFDKFVNISALSAADAARAVAAEGIDILVNLNGYFGKMRMDLFARRPAPVQVNYLGFPATLGADYIDYIVADRQVIPENEARFYAEKVAWLPHSYQPNDDKRAMGEQTTRAAHGLPEQAFVFCHFNYGWKLTPASFAGWMRILAQVPQSLLWLLESNDLFADNLRGAARSHGIDPARLVFAPQVTMEDHLARLRLGDLFLDSLPYGAHTTASDALWAGLPLVTQRGATFPGRVSASLLTAIGLPELITETQNDFEGLAVALANDPARLEALRQTLAANRATHPLFDTALYTRHLEAAYLRMQQQRGAPQSFAVPA